MINYYLVEVKGRKIRNFIARIIKLRINVYDLNYYKDRVTFKVSYDNYLRIKEIKSIYEVNIISIKGRNLYKKILKEYRIFFIFFLAGLILLLLLSNMIFFIEVDHDKKEIRDLMTKALKDNGLTIYSFAKSYQKLEGIKDKIKKDNNDKIEWLEIEHIGITYKVKVIERKQESLPQDNTPKDIVAKSNGMILEMYISKGDIIKNKGDYVSRGSIIVSGTIKRNDNVLGYTKASGKVYAETWYKVKVDSSFFYDEVINDTKGTKAIIIKVFGKEIKLFKRKRTIKKEQSKVLFSSSFMTIINKHEFNKTIKKVKYDETILKKKLEAIAKDEITKTLADDEKILTQKTLKTTTINGKMYIEVFFKLYENIAIEKDIVKEIPKKE